jgi:hypothetical protein
MTALSPEVVAFRSRRIRLLTRNIGVEVVALRVLGVVGRPFVRLIRGAPRCTSPTPTPPHDANGRIPRCS